MNQANVDPAQAQRMLATMLPIFGLLMLLFYALLIVPFWFAFKKAGLSPWLSLLALIPIPLVGLLLPLYILAFARWRVVPMAAEYPPYPPAGYPPMQYVQAEYPQPVAPVYPPSPQTPTSPPAGPSSEG